MNGYGSGLYSVAFILGIPGREAEIQFNISEFISSGRSLLSLLSAEERVIFHVYDRTTCEDIELSTNEKGQISKIEMDVFASSFIEAERKAGDYILPLLSSLSFHQDIPLDFIGIETREKWTNVMSWVFNQPGDGRKISQADAFPYKPFTTPEIRNLLSTYREAQNSSNVFYQIICFYKITEGIKTLRERKKEELLAFGQQYTAPAERIPESPDKLIGVPEHFKKRFTPFLGKKFSYVIEHYRSVYRNALAHLDFSKNTFNYDSLDDISNCRDAVTVIKYISRIQILNESEKLQQQNNITPTAVVHAQQTGRQI